jgi:TPR repeat protein
MRSSVVSYVLIAAFSLVLGSAAGGAAEQDEQFEEGMTAYEAGNFAGALEAWRPLAAQGHTEAQFNLGYLHARGEGVKVPGTKVLML